MHECFLAVKMLHAGAYVASHAKQHMRDVSSACTRSACANEAYYERERTARSAKSQLFSLLVATGRRVLNSAPHAVLN